MVVLRFLDEDEYVIGEGNFARISHKYPLFHFATQRRSLFQVHRVQCKLVPAYILCSGVTRSTDWWIYPCIDISNRSRMQGLRERNKGTDSETRSIHTGVAFVPVPRAWSLYDGPCDNIGSDEIILTLRVKNHFSWLSKVTRLIK